MTSRMRAKILCAVSAYSGIEPKELHEIIEWILDRGQDRFAEWKPLGPSFLLDTDNRINALEKRAAHAETCLAKLLERTSKNMSRLKALESWMDRVRGGLE